MPENQNIPVRIFENYCGFYSKKVKMAIEKEKSKILLDKVNSFKTELESKRKSNTKKVDVDNMIVNLGNPRLAEKMRIHKVSFRLC